MFEYDVVIVGSKIGGRHSYSEKRLRDTLDAYAHDGWQLKWIVTEPERLLVTFERPITF